MNCLSYESRREKMKQQVNKLLFAIFAAKLYINLILSFFVLIKNKVRARLGFAFPIPTNLGCFWGVLEVHGGGQ